MVDTTMTSAGNDSQQFFEGTEKLLEVWFDSSDDDDRDDLDLRSIPKGDWDRLLQLVCCEIISVASNHDMDAYVLSESSMFVTPCRFILKTCGTTTLLHCVGPLLALVKTKVGFDRVVDIFYSRKNFSRPELQIGVHQNFENEVQELDRIFPNGSAYTLGRINRDCWYLYTLEDEGVTKPDQTFELLMWDMCPDKMSIFTREMCATGQQATEKSGICDIIPGMQIDDFLFEPCGYSMNGLLPEGQYITIHVTPEPECSYVSFESNVPQETYHDLMHKVLGVFCPGQFLVTIFANKASIARDTHKTLDDEDLVPGYVRRDHQLCCFKNYTLTYTQYAKVTAPRSPTALCLKDMLQDTAPPSSAAVLTTAAAGTRPSLAAAIAATSAVSDSTTTSLPALPVSAATSAVSASATTSPPQLPASALPVSAATSAVSASATTSLHQLPASALPVSAAALSASTIANLPQLSASIFSAASSLSQPASPPNPKLYQCWSTEARCLAPNPNCNSNPNCTEARCLAPNPNCNEALWFAPNPNCTEVLWFAPPII